MTAQRNDRRSVIALLVVILALPLLAGCAAPAEKETPGYVGAAPNAAPAKKGTGSGTEAP